MPLKALKSIQTAGGKSPRTYLRKIDYRLAEAAGSTVNYQGQLYTMGTPEPGSSRAGEKPGEVIEVPGRKPLYGSGGKLAGYVLPDGTVQVSGAGTDSPDEVKKKVYIPKPVGVDVVWDDPNAGGRHSMDDRGNGRQGYFFPFSADDKPCIQCSGKGYMRDEAIAPTKPGELTKPKPCVACKGVGRFIRRAEEFAKSMSAMGLAPKMMVSRGKERKYPLAPSAAYDAPPPKAAKGRGPAAPAAPAMAPEADPAFEGIPPERIKTLTPEQIKTLRHIAKQLARGLLDQKDANFLRADALQ